MKIPKMVTVAYCAATVSVSQRQQIKKTRLELKRTVIEFAALMKKDDSVYQVLK